jgi:tRNA(Ile)-lysidine synthase
LPRAVSTPNVNDAAVARFGEDLTALISPLGDTARIGLAVSGGPDSLALPLLAHAALPGRISVATVDHGLRPEAADEAAMVGRVCGELGVPHVILNQDRHPGLVPGSTDQRTPTQEDEWMPEQVRHDGGGNVQAKARMLRYRLLGNWAEREGLNFIATAHHRDDVAESFLMRALRGSGVGGLAQMGACGPIPYASDAKARLIRPLLGWDRTELAQIVQQAGLIPAQDPSNADPRYDRVRIRDLLKREPLLEPEPLARAAANLADAEAALDWMTDQAWRSRTERLESGDLWIDPNDLPTEIQRRMAARAIGLLSPGWDGDGLDRMVAQLIAGKTATLAGVKGSGGEVWRFGIAPAHRGHR